MEYLYYQRGSLSHGRFWPTQIPSKDSRSTDLIHLLTSIPTGVFKIKDGYINIASAGQAIWERFCKAIEAEEFLSDLRYANGAALATSLCAQRGYPDIYPTLLQ